MWLVSASCATTHEKLMVDQSKHNKRRKSDNIKKLEDNAKN